MLAIWRSCLSNSGNFYNILLFSHKILCVILFFMFFMRVALVYHFIKWSMFDILLWVISHTHKINNLIIYFISILYSCIYYVIMNVSLNITLKIITVYSVALKRSVKESFNNLDSFSLPEIEEFIGNLGMVCAMLGRKLLSFETRGCASGSRYFFRHFLHQSATATLSKFLAIIFTHCSFPSNPFLVLYAIF